MLLSSKTENNFRMLKLVFCEVLLIIMISMSGIFASALSAQVTTYQPPATGYVSGTSTSSAMPTVQTFNTDQIYNPLIGGSSSSLTTPSALMTVPTEQPAASGNDYQIKGKLPIYLTGDYVEYRMNEEKVVAKGAAEAKHDKMDIIANNIEADLSKELVFAQGNVVYWQEQNGKLKKITGDFLVYNIKTGDGFMLDAVIYSDPTVTKAKRVDLSANKVTAPEGAVYTSCDLDHPHWFIDAKDVTIYPNDKMVIKKASYNIFGMKLISVPHLTMSLKKQDQKKFKMNMSYTKTKGLYQTLAWDYFFNDNQYGSLGIENQSKKGYFQNISHNYKFKDKITGTFYSDYSYDSIRNENIARNSLAGQYQIKGNANLSYNLDYFSDVMGGVTQNRELNSQYNLSYNEQNYDFLVRYKKRTDLNETPNQYVSSLDYTPEINVNTRREKVLKTPLFISTRSILGMREETLGSTFLKRNVFDTQWRVDTERFQLSSLTNLTLDSSYRLRADKTDERENILAGGASLTQNLGKFVNANIRYDNTRSYGYYPFQSNRIQTQNKMYSTLAYNGPTASDEGIEVRSNLMQFYYDYDAHQFQNVSNDLTFTVKEDKFKYHRLYLRANYDFADTMFSNFFSGKVNMTNLYMKYDYQLGEKIDWQTSTTYDRITKKFQTMNSSMQFDLGPFWRVNTDVIYDLTEKQLRNVNYYLIRDLHCMEASIRANPHQKEFYIEFGLKAFPGDRQRGYYDKASGRFKRSNTNERVFF